MKNNLQACRQALLRELHRINREIALTENKITQLRSNIAVIRQQRVKAA